MPKSYPFAARQQQAAQAKALNQAYFQEATQRRAQRIQQSTPKPSIWTRAKLALVALWTRLVEVCRG